MTHRHQNPGFRIRRALPQDAPRLTEIAFAAKRHWRYPEAYIKLWSAELTFDSAYILEHHVWVAESDRELIALYALAEREACLELEHLWVLPPVIGHGVGRAMLEHASGQARAMGRHAVTIVSDPNSEGFYIRLGARRTGTTPSTPKGRMLPVLELCVTSPGSADGSVP